MSDRYRQVKLYDKFKFCPTSPVDILKGAIYIDNITSKAVFQLKFINMQDKNIKAVYISVVGYDDLGKELENKEYSYLDLNVNKSVEFGTEQLKELSNTSIRNIEVIIDKVIYEDNEIWQNKNDVAFDRKDLHYIDKEFLDIANGKLTQQRILADSIYYPTQNENYWTCLCGTYNSNNNDKCYKCNYSKGKAFEEFNKDKLTKEFEDYKNNKQDKNHIKKSRWQKILKVFIILFILSVLIGIIIYNIPRKVDLQIFIENSASTEQEQDIKNQIEKICNTTDIQYVSKDEALDIMRERLGDEENILKDFEKDNIFSSSYVIQISSTKINKMRNKLTEINGVKKVVGSNETIKAIIRLVIFSVLGGLLFCIIVIRLRIYCLDRSIKK